jgi:hypothetical protein
VGFREEYRALYSIAREPNSYNFPFYFFEKRLLVQSILIDRLTKSIYSVDRHVRSVIAIMQGHDLTIKGKIKASLQKGTP